MKRALIIFLVLLIATMTVPLIAAARSSRNATNEELVTIFSSDVTTAAASPTPRS